MRPELAVAAHRNLIYGAQHIHKLQIVRRRTFFSRQIVNVLYARLIPVLTIKRLRTVIDVLGIRERVEELQPVRESLLELHLQAVVIGKAACVIPADRAETLNRAA